ncbi:MAG: PaaI family thioesterase [Acidimicrobiales bacterium]|nr:PaaI family thioesterase [Acidimicrobiales bacterium]
MSSLSSSQLTELLGLMPFSEGLGVKLENADPSTVAGTLAWSAERCTSDGILHGGAIMALADSVGAICAYLNLPEGATTSTIESKTNFFRGVRSGFVRATAKPVHIGNRTIVVQTDLLDEEDRSVALVIQTQAVLGRA